MDAFVTESNRFHEREIVAEQQPGLFSARQLPFAGAHIYRLLPFISMIQQRIDSGIGVKYRNPSLRRAAYALIAAVAVLHQVQFCSHSRITPLDGNGINNETEMSR